jgi:hypothetical protein
MSAPSRGPLLPLSPLERLVEEFVTTTVPCPVCEIPAGCRCDGPVCTPRRTAALDQYLGGRRCRKDPDRPPVERSPRQLLAAGRHHVAAVIPTTARWTLRDLSRMHMAQRLVLLNGGALWNRTTVRPVQ